MVDIDISSFDPPKPCKIGVVVVCVHVCVHMHICVTGGCFVHIHNSSFSHPSLYFSTFSSPF